MTKPFLLRFYLLALLGLLAAGQLQAAQVQAMRLWVAPDHTRIVFDLDSPVNYRLITLSNPDRLVIDLDQAAMAADVKQLQLDKSPVRQVRHGRRDSDQLRVVFDLKQNVKPRSFLLPPQGDYGHRLVVDLQDPDKTATVVKSQRDFKQFRDVVVAIDAGHGGEDPGASGPNRLREKHVVLAIAKELYQLLEQEPGYKPVLIRKGDYYVSLKGRRDLARKAQADLLVSVHADAFTDSRAHGASVYALSKRGASSASARFLAEEANSADLVGGVTLSDKDDVLAGVLTDLSMTASLDASLTVGEEVLKEMGHSARLHSKRVEQAAFAVLKSPDIPSILVETGFISNPGEARKLASRRYQKRMAKHIFDGITRWFRSSPPPGTRLAALRSGELKPREYVVVRGDTLSEIAARHNVTVNALRNHNSLAGNTIRIGQKLVIPAS